MAIYTPVSVSGYNANPPPDDGTQDSSNEISWSKHKTKLTDPLKTALESIDTNVQAFASTTEALVPAGVVFPWAGASATSPPTGFLLCFGQAVSRSTYSALFTAVGTTYGSGDGSTTFNLPDIRGRVVAGQDDMGGSSANRLTNQTGGLNGDTIGATGGSETHTITQAQLPSYNLDASGMSFTVTGEETLVARIIGNATAAAAGSSFNVYTNTAFTTTTLGVTTSSTIPSGGSGTAINNVQPTIILNYIIKT